MAYHRVKEADLSQYGRNSGYAIGYEEYFVTNLVLFNIECLSSFPSFSLCRFCSACVELGMLQVPDKVMNPSCCLFRIKVYTSTESFKCFYGQPVTLMCPLQHFMLGFFCGLLTPTITGLFRDHFKYQLFTSPSCYRTPPPPHTHTQILWLRLNGGFHPWMTQFG